MGGWSPSNRGALWELDLQSQTKKIWKLVKGLQIPHGLAWGPDGNLYVGESHRIIRFSKEALIHRSTLVADVVVDNLKADGSANMHPLINFTFGQSADDKGDLYVNMGAPTDACVKDAPNKCSVENRQGLIRKYTYQSGLNRYNPDFTVVAKGLRNSMGLISHPSGLLLQAENSRDFSEANEPFDELNVIKTGKHFGWPYCYNFKATSPEWQNVVDCKTGFESPFLLFPPHSAPLDLVYYNGDLFPEMRGHLLASWHGYKPAGSKVVAFPTDETGLPILATSPQWDYANGTTRQIAQPDGGNLRASRYSELITNWEKRDGVRPAGAPVGLLVASDGSIYIVEDKNKTVLRLAKSSGKTGPEIDEAQLELAKRVKVYRALKNLEAKPELKEAFNWINSNVFQTSCVTCHDQVKGSGTQSFEFMIGEGWIEPGNQTSPILQRLKGLNGLNRMPLGGELPTKTIDYIQQWIQRLQ